MLPKLKRGEIGLVTKLVIIVLIIFIAVLMARQAGKSIGAQTACENRGGYCINPGEECNTPSTYECADEKVCCLKEV